MAPPVAAFGLRLFAALVGAGAGVVGGLVNSPLSAYRALLISFNG